MVLNIKDFPDDLCFEAKIRALHQGITLREYIINSVQTAVNSEPIEWVDMDDVIKEARKTERAKKKGGKA
jgi:hypothetical protein